MKKTIDELKAQLVELKEESRRASAEHEQAQKTLDEKRQMADVAFNSWWNLSQYIRSEEEKQKKGKRK